MNEEDLKTSIIRIQPHIQEIGNLYKLGTLGEFQLEMMCESLSSIANRVSSLGMLSFDLAKVKGFHDNDDNPSRMAEYVANLHEEVSELWDAHRSSSLLEPCDKTEEMNSMGLPAITKLQEEIADVIIRAVDTYVGVNGSEVGLGDAIVYKTLFNATRPKRHGKVC